MREGRGQLAVGLGLARVVDQDIKSAKLRESGIYRRLRILWTGDVECGCQQAFVIAHCSRDLRRIARHGMILIWTTSDPKT